MMNSPSKVDTAALRVEQDLAAHPVARLPTLETLARTYGVSLVTMHKAIKSLCAKGLLDARQGRGIFMVGSVDEKPDDTLNRETDRVEGHLRALIAGSSAQRLPSITELVKHYRASTASVRLALCRLRDKGLVSIAQGRRAVIVRDESPAREDALGPSMTSEDALYQRMRAAIETGTYRSAQPLPKYSYLVAAEKVAVRTVVRVYRRLVRDGLICKKGRSYIVGQSPPAAGTIPHHLRKVIIVLQPTEATWDDFTNASWISPFLQTFIREMSMFGVELRAMLFDRGEFSPCYDGTALTREEITRVVKQLDHRLVGFLVVNMLWADHHAGHAREYLSLMRWLCEFKKRVAFFEPIYDTAHADIPGPQPHEMLEEQLRHPLVRRNFVRCCYDPENQIPLALSILRKHGHRLLGFPTPGPKAQWMDDRIVALRSAIAQGKLPMHICDSTDCPALFDIHPEMSIGDVKGLLLTIDAPFAPALIDAVGAMGTSSTRVGDLSPAQQELIHLTPHLGAFLAKPDLTAIVAPNDEHARRFYRWCAAASTKIPDNLSLLAFDNWIEGSFPYAISSINFGFDNLGYAAFHILLGDVPVKVNNSRMVQTKSRINHYATIGEAGRNFR
jgi:DNA-binding GntR family transcriptional regulator